MSGLVLARGCLNFLYICGHHYCARDLKQKVCRKSPAKERMQSAHALTDSFNRSWDENSCLYRKVSVVGSSLPLPDPLDVNE